MNQQVESIEKKRLVFLQRRRFILLIISVLILVTVGLLVALKNRVGLPSQQQIVSSSSPSLTVTKEYSSERFGFSFKYPSNYVSKSLGPNISQQQIESGESISGTIPPSFDTIVFHLSDQPDFLVIFYDYNLLGLHPPSLENFTIGGECGSQFITEMVKDIYHPDTSPPYLERVQRENGKFNLNYCFINGTGQVTAVKFENIVPDNLDQTQRLAGEIVASVQITQPVPTDILPTAVFESCSSYINRQAGFSLNCPTNVVFGDSQEAGKFNLRISVNNIETLDQPMGYTKDTVIKDQRALANGEFGEQIDWPFGPSKTVVKIGDTHGKSFVVFQRFSTSDVTFERMLIFYRQGYQIVLTLKADTVSMIKSMPQFFPNYDTTQFGQNWEWKTDDQLKLSQALEAGTASAMANSWYGAFDEIVASIRLL